MKKILALVLAVMMLATVAFAAVTNPSPGTKMKYSLGASNSSTPGVLTATDSTAGWPDITALGSVVYFGKEIGATNYSISSVKWDKGAALVASIGFNSDGDFQIELKKDYTMEYTPAGTNPAKGKLLEGSFKILEKGSAKSRSYELGRASNEIYVGYTVTEETLQEDSGKTFPSAGKPVKTIYKVKAGTDAQGKEVAYNTVTILDAMDNEISVRLYKDEKLFLQSNPDANLDVVKKYDDSGADLRFVNFPAKPTFSSTATYYFYNVDETDFIYNVGANGTISASGAKWSEDDGCWVLKTRTLGSYVISDVKLAVSATDSTVTNPDTGANDVVGIATAMAVVALVSAAAVSLKK